MGKYKLPSSHALFQTQTVTDLLLEQLEDLYEERSDLMRQLEDGAGAATTAVNARLNKLNSALGESSGDDLLDFWDAELKAGRVPDLDMTMEDLAEVRRQRG